MLYLIVFNQKMSNNYQDVNFFFVCKYLSVFSAVFSLFLVETVQNNVFLKNICAESKSLKFFTLEKSKMMREYIILTRII